MRTFTGIEHFLVRMFLRNPCSHSKMVSIQSFQLPYLISSSKATDALPSLQKLTQVHDKELGNWNAKEH